MRHMRSWLSRIGLAVAISTIAFGATSNGADDDNRMIAHNVFFALKDKSPESVKRAIETCKRHLTGQPGVIFFAVGARDTIRDGGPALDRNFDFSLHIVFRDRDAHQRYMESDRKKDFTRANRLDWGKVRFFVSVVEK